MVKSRPATQETQVQSLGGEDPLGKEMATHSSVLAWKIPFTEKRGRRQSLGSQRVRPASACMYMTIMNAPEAFCAFPCFYIPSFLTHVES